MNFPYLGSYPGAYQGTYPGPGLFMPSVFTDATDRDLLKFPEETQLELLRYGGDSPEELHRELEELQKKE